MENCATKNETNERGTSGNCFSAFPKNRDDMISEAQAFLPCAAELNLSDKKAIEFFGERKKKDGAE